MRGLAETALTVGLCASHDFYIPIPVNMGMKLPVLSWLRPRPEASSSQLASPSWLITMRPVTLGRGDVVPHEAYPRQPPKKGLTVTSRIPT